MKSRVIPLLVLAFIFSGFVPLAHAAAPFIYGIQARSITGTGIEITWSTNAPSNSVGYYDTLNISSFGATSAVRCDAGGNVTSHCVRATGLAGNTDYYFEILSCVPGGSCGVQFISQKTADGPPLYNPPKVPSGLTMSLDGTSVNLKWSDNSDNESGFTIDKNGGGLWTTIANVKANVTSYTDQNLSGGNYKYRVSSFITLPGIMQVNSAPSNQVSITIAETPTAPPPLPGTPATPTGACIVRNYYTAMPGLSAPDSSTGYAKTMKPGINDIPELRNGCTSADFEALLKTYCAFNYSSAIEQVATYDASGNVARVACRTDACTEVQCPVAVTAAPDTTPPIAPLLTASAVSASEVHLAWNSAAEDLGVIGYKVYRNGVALKNEVTALSYDDTGLQTGSEYSYFVKAYDAAGNYSPESNRVSVTTLQPIEQGAASSNASGTQSAATITLPKIFDVQAEDVTSAEAKIVWATELPSGSHINWGTQSNTYPQKSKWRCDGDGFVTSHCVNLTGLNPQTTYYYRAISTSPDGYVEYSPEFTFTTPATTKEASSETASFVTDTTPPRVTSFSVSPLKSSAQAMFTVKFSKSIRPEAVSAESVFVYPADYPAYRVPGTLALRPNGFDFITQNLPDADHILVVKKSIKDLAGNELAEDYTSLPVRQHAAGQPTYAYPPTGERVPLYVTGWVLNVDELSGMSIMGIRFNTDLDQSTVHAKSIFIKNAEGSASTQSQIQGSLATGSRSISFVTKAPLTTGVRYTGVVAANIKSAEGISLGADFICSFAAITEGYYTSCPVGKTTPPAPLPEVRNIETAPNAIFSGTVADSEGKAIPDATVYIAGEHSANALTGTDGTFTMTLPGGRYTARAFSPSGREDALIVPPPTEFILEKGGRHSETFTFGIVDTAPKRLSGKVLFTTGDPVLGAQVSAYNTASSDLTTVFTNDEGAYEMKVSGGEWIVSVAPRDASAVWHYEGGNRTARFKHDMNLETAIADFRVVSEYAKITAHVQDDNKKSLQAGVTLDSISSRGVGIVATTTKRISRFGISDADGNITFTVPPGTYYIRAALPRERGLVNPFEREVHPRANTESQLLLIFRNQGVAATALLLGKVTFEDGRAAPNAFVWGWSERGESLTTHTNERGEFSMQVRSGARWHVGASLEVNGFGYASGDTVIESGQSAKFIGLILIKKKKEPLAPPVIAEQAANTTVVVESRDGAKVVVPPVSQNASETISVSIVPSVDAPSGPGIRVIGTTYDITLKDSQGRAVTDFKDGLEISLPYTDEELKRAGVSLENLTPSYFDKTGTWVKIDSYIVDPIHHVIIVRVKHLTRFALVAPEDFAPPLPVSQIQVRRAGGGAVLTWKNPPSNFHHVKVYRSESKGALGLLLDDFVIAETSLYVDEDTKIGATYYYAVVGVSAAGNEALPTISEGITIQSSVAPPPSQASGTPGTQVPMMQLYRGMRGPRVWTLQQTLEDLGFFPKEIGPTGYFGPITQSSVRTFQASRGLPPTGIVEASTTLELDNVLKLK